MGVKHAFTSPVAASASSTDVDGPVWNQDHLSIPEYIPLLVSSSNTAITFTASAAANTELFPTSKATRRELDLSTCTQVRLRAMVTANGNAAGAAIKLQYTTTEAATWSGSDLVTPAANLVLGTGTIGLLRDTGWLNLVAGAIGADRTVAVIVAVAFGTTAPAIGSLVIAFR